MKYLILLGDGMADLKLEERTTKHPSICQTPHMDMLAARCFGLAYTVPKGYPRAAMWPISRSWAMIRPNIIPALPLEAVSMGVELEPNDVAFRCNLVTLH